MLLNLVILTALVNGAVMLRSTKRSVDESLSGTSCCYPKKYAWSISRKFEEGTIGGETNTSTSSELLVVKPAYEYSKKEKFVSLDVRTSPTTGTFYLYYPKFGCMTVGDFRSFPFDIEARYCTAEKYVESKEIKGTEYNVYESGDEQWGTLTQLYATNEEDGNCYPRFTVESSTRGNGQFTKQYSNYENLEFTPELESLLEVPEDPKLCDDSLTSEIVAYLWS